MDYTQSDANVTDISTGSRMHQSTAPITTEVSPEDMNGLIWEALELIKAADLVPAAFNKTLLGSYTQVRDAVDILARKKSAAIASATGSADVLIGVYAPVVPALVNGLTLYLRAASANATTTPTFSPNDGVIAAKNIVKGNGLPLVAGDIAGAGHWLTLKYDVTLDKWVLMNPAMGVGINAALRDELAANNPSKASALIVQPTEYVDEQPTSVFSILRGRANVKRFWVTADGADWKNAFRKASASGARNIIVPGDVLYTVSDQIDMLDDQDWYLDNAKVTLTDPTKVLFSSVQKSRWGIRGRSFLYGSLTVAATAVETGLRIDGGKRYVVEGLTAAKFIGKGIHLTGTLNQDGVFRGDRGHFSDVAVHENTTGAQVDAGAASEYNTWSNLHSSGNIVGMAMAAGNNTVSGGSIVDNTRGVVLTAGGNHCHGMFTGVNINHNITYNLEATDVTLGHDFIGCHFYGSGGGAGAIFLNNSKGIVLDGGHLDCWVYDYSGASSGYNYIRNMYCPGSYGDIERLDVGSLTPTELIILGCYGPGAYKLGVSINDPGPVYVHVRREPVSTQVVGSATPLIFNTELSNGDRRAAYNAATGAFTVPADQGGQYRLGANLYFSGTAMSAAASYVQVLVNGVAPSLYLLNLYGTTILTTTITQDLYLNPGDVVTIEATVAGTAPVFGGTSWTSNLSIERIA